MKNFAIALTALSLVAGAAHAGSFSKQMDSERRDVVPVSSYAGHSVQVRAGDLLSRKELDNSPLSASDLVSVTRIPSSDVIDTGK